ncbi:MAG: 16S rRNA (cytidine(1402)-2'-O)-methyltransferase [Nitrospira defluvii]|nr:16S rRNA (cytidine(1402)-2'-O)-methyltransferase [Nitrospira defluvii]
MRQEQSQGKHVRSGRLPGTLFIVGMPIGHPDDLTIRALRIFRHVGLVASKHPHATQTLLAHHGIHITLTTYDRVNAAEKVPILLGRLKQGTHIALVSDCGMPVVYDPGRLLIQAASTSNIPIEVIPGTSAVVTAAAVAGLDGNAFVFEGRWSGGVRELTRRLGSLRSESRTMILFPPAQALRQILTLLSRILGNRRVVVAADLTHKTQQIVRGRAQEVLEHYPFREGLRQVTLVVEGMRPTRKRAREVP